MLKLTRSLTLSATALSIAVLLGAAAPSSGGATRVINGNGRWVVPDGSTIGFQVHLVELPDGTLNGHGSSSRHSDVDGNSWFHFDVIDSAPWNGDLAVLGKLTATMNTPPQMTVGSLTVLLIQDNGQGGGAADKATSASGLPPFLTLADILPQSPPPSEWFTLASGDFVIH